MATKEFLIQAMQWSHSEPYMLMPSLPFVIIQLEVNFTLLLNKELQNLSRDHLEVFKQF